MVIDQWHADAFEGYAKPLKKLEKAFNKAGVPVTFYAFVTPKKSKMVEIIYMDKREPDLMCIEWESPAQAVKEVARAVRL